MALRDVVAPIPGTFYRRPDPNSDPFVVEGGDVGPEDTIALIEVMKNFHPVPAGTAGRLVEFRVDNEEVVSPGEVLAVIEDGE